MRPADPRLDKEKRTASRSPDGVRDPKRIRAGLDGETSAATNGAGNPSANNNPMLQALLAMSAQSTQQAVVVFKQEQAQARYDAAVTAYEAGKMFYAAFPAIRERRTLVKNQEHKNVEILKKQLEQMQNQHLEQLQEMSVLLTPPKEPAFSKNDFVSSVTFDRLAQHSITRHEAEQLKSQYDTSVSDLKKDMQQQVNNLSPTIATLQSRVDALQEQTDGRANTPTAAEQKTVTTPEEVEELKRKIQASQNEQVKRLEGIIYASQETVISHVDSAVKDFEAQVDRAVTGVEGKFDEEVTTFRTAGVDNVVAQRLQSQLSERATIADVGSLRQSIEKMTSDVASLIADVGGLKTAPLQNGRNPSPKLNGAPQPGQLQTHGHPQQRDLSERCEAMSRAIASLEFRFNNLTTDDVCQAMLSQLEAVWPHSAAYEKSMRAVKNDLQEMKKASGEEDTKIKATIANLERSFGNLDGILTTVSTELGALKGKVQGLHRAVHPPAE